ncbi:MAG: hypothetical protein U0T33_03880 [Bacteroidales bacterium]
MIKNTNPTSLKRSILRFTFAFSIFLSSVVMSGQSLPDFSGDWKQDATKSDEFYKDFDIKCTITQTGQNMLIKSVYYDKSGKELVTRESTFPLDGKEITDKDGARKTAKWSADRKTLVTTDTKNYGGDIVGVTASYSLSENGQVLTVKTSDIKPGVRTVTQVLNKENK